MRAAVLREVGPGRPYAESRPLTVENLPDITPRAGELGIDIVYSSLCHSDLSVVDGSRVRPMPMALGHEAVGRVTALGEGVDDVAIGDRVVLVFVPSCGRCRMCRRGRPALCSRAAEANGSGDLLHGPALLRDADGTRINHHLGVSAFADRAVVARESAVVIPDGAPDEVAAMLGCAVLTGAGAVLNTADVAPGDAVAVFGLGAVGLAALMAARLAGADVVIGIDPNPAKHDVARRAGATHTCTPEEAGAIVREVTDGGADLVVEAAGAVKAIESAMDLLGRGGTCVCVGLPHPEAELRLNALQFAGAGKRLVGSYIGDAVPSRDIPALLEHWAQGRLPLELLHTDTRPLDDINDALDALVEGTVIRRLFIA